MRAPSLLAVLALPSLLSVPAVRAGDFAVFESGHVRPLALSSDGATLYAVNTPDGRLEILDVRGARPLVVGSVPVGLEPVAVALADDTEAWVVNHLSDSVSIVDLDADPPRVVRTLLVGDEPRDVVFAAARAYVTTAHRGQNVPYDPQLTKSGVGRADVWVFDPEDLGDSLEGEPVTIVTLFGDTPRALAASPDGTRVYAAIFHSGNQTTVLNEHSVCDGGVDAVCFVDGVRMPGGLPPPQTNATGVTRPEVGLIVKYDPESGGWLDPIGRDWRDAVRLDLPDYDVFAIDARAPTPAVVDRFASVGTILFNMVVNPVTGALYVSNNEARNEVRFEGPAITADTSVRGRLHQARITVIEPDSGAVLPRPLNPHIDYDRAPSPPGTKERSLATPLEMAVSRDGATLYVAAFGSGTVGVLPANELESGTIVPDANDQIVLSAGGPSGLALDEARGRLYVATRFDNGISVVDASQAAEVSHVRLYNPEPESVVAGRPFLYDARLGSSNGEASCSSCHVFGDVDDLAWDLGNPDAEVVRVGFRDFHPMKGPMTVQTLRGLAGHGPMHWRGERNGAALGGEESDERAAFAQFNGAFVDLLGRDRELREEEMEAYTDFVLQILPPPNPVRALDDSLTPEEAIGRELYFGTFITCSICHTLDPEKGLFGTNATHSEALETQPFKTPQLRNMYARVGMFGMAGGGMFGVGGTEHTGPQIRGFGYIHDGSVDTLFRFLSAGIFNLSTDEKRKLEAFLLAFDSNLAPIVGQQVTVGARTGGAAAERARLLEQRHLAGECDLVARAAVGGEMRGWVETEDGFRSDRQGEIASRSDLAAIDRVTYTCVPPGSGVRIGIDRDGDGFLDGDERDLCTNPANAASDPITDPCTGDCDASCSVTIDELLRGVHVALEADGLSTCAAFDADSSGTVEIDELVAGVGKALTGCPAS